MRTLLSECSKSIDGTSSLRYIIIMNMRYEAWLKTDQTELYPLWLEAQMQQWARESGRRDEMNIEQGRGWHFPILVSAKDNADFDRWLTEAAQLPNYTI